MGCLGGSSAEAQSKEQKEKSKLIEKQLDKDRQKYKATHRLLLLGRYFYCIPNSDISSPIES